MGVLFLCIDQEYSCAYGSWNIVRKEMLCATMRYLKSRVDVTDPEKMLYNKMICEILEHEVGLTKGVDEFLEIMTENRKLINHFIALDIYGLYALTNKADDCGYYSPGNSKDILMLFKRVKPFIMDENVAQRVSQIRRMFRESIKKNHCITIC
jgi:hypothetical protein